MNELCYTIDGFDVHIDPFRDPGCFNIQDKVIIGLLGAAFIFSIPFLNLILALLYPIFWCLGFILPQINSRELVIAQSKKLRQEKKDLRLARINQIIIEASAGPSAFDEQDEESMNVELDNRSKRILQEMYGIESNKEFESNVIAQHEKKPSVLTTISDAIFMGIT